jgi:tartrate dehydratase alpha subunit/fumarate hydratase class I-like protein
MSAVSELNRLGVGLVGVGGVLVAAGVAASAAILWSFGLAAVAVAAAVLVGTHSPGLV